MDIIPIDVRIQNVIDNKINPVLIKHNGSARLSSYENGIVWVKMEGACGNCPAAKDTIENVVKKVLREDIPEVTDVLLDDSIDEDMLEIARKLLR